MRLTPSFLAAAAAGGVAVIARMWKHRHAAATEERILERRPIGKDGIIPGAAGFALHRPHAPAVLLLHGAGDTPAALRYLAEHLHERGYAVRAPLLPGHGRTIREFAQVTAEAWYEAARDALHELRRDHEWVAVVGLSMGGALAARLAGDPEFPDVPAVVLLAPYLEPPAFVRWAALTSVGWGTVATYVDSLDPRSIHDESERGRALGYGVMTPAALRALVRVAAGASRGLPQVTAPTLMIQSLHDNRISAAGARRAFARIGSAEKRMIWRDVGGHILTVDHGREDVIADVASWLGTHGGATAETRKGGS